MSETLDRAAEILKLARLLDVPADELGYLEQVPSAALTRFRAQATDRLFAGDAERLRRVAAASKLVPIPLTVKISQLAFGPVLCAATAGLLDSPHAVKVASKVPTPFLADIAVHLDPRRAPEVLAAIPPDIVARVAIELVRRGEYVTMGRFVNVLPRATLRAVVPQIEDEADLLRVAFVMEGKDSLDELLDIARDRVQRLIDAAHRHDMWAEALDLITNLDDANRAELADTATAQDTEVLDSLIRAAHRQRMWDAVLPLTSSMSEQSLRRFANIPAVLDPDVLDDIIAAVLDGELWLDLLPLATALPPPALGRVAHAVAAMDDDRLQNLAELAHTAGRWDAMLAIAFALDEPTRHRLAGLPLFARTEVLTAAITAAAELERWDAVLPLARAIPEAIRPRLAASIGELTSEQLLAGLQAAARSDELDLLVDIALRQDLSGRRRVVELLTATDRLEEFTRLLDRSTSDVVWDALVEVADELPPAVRDLVRRRARDLGRDDVVTGLDAADDAAVPGPSQEP